MDLLYPRCAGLDVHKNSDVARIRCVSEPVHDEVKTFATTTSALLELNEFMSGLQQAIAELDANVGKALESIHKSAQLLTTMPGVSEVAAHVMVAEIGVDMTRFATDAHLRSWAGFCPRSDETAGKRRSTRVRKGGPWLKTTLVTAAWAAVRVKNSYLQSQFHRLRARRGAKKAILAVASSMLTAA
jgi:transposase